MSQEKKQNEKKANHNFKLQLLGELSAGLAHEINNPLSSISLYAERIESILSDYNEEKNYDPSAPLDEESIRSTTQSINKEIKRIGDILNSINHFSKPQESTFLPVSDLNRIFDEVKHLCNYLLLKHNVKLSIIDQKDQATNVKNVIINYSFLIHALVNLIKNSCEALERNKIQDRWVKIYTLISDSKLVILVQDSGLKESDAEQQNYFESGFTKKDTGTGLGLNISRNLLDTYGAKLDPVSNCETTTMRIVLNLQNE